MAQYLNFSARNCLEWTTHHSPPYNRHIESPCFSFLGCDCYFSFNRYASVKGKGYITYILTIRSMDNTKPLVSDATIFAHLSKNDPYKYIASGTCTFYKNAELCRVEASTHIGQWNIICIFSTDSPTELQVYKDETMQISNLGDLNNQPSSDSILMKAKMSAVAPDESPSGLEILSSDLGKLLEQKSLPDVTLRCGGCTFSAHRLILAARSEVFAAMFQNKMAESETGDVDITDIDGEVLDLLVKYVYSGKIPELSFDTASSLFIAADKYSIHSLKMDCSKWMLERLTDKNCLEVLCLANTCSDARFKGRVVNFIAEIFDLLEEEVWLKFSDEHPRLANSVLQRRVLITKKN